jgi:hypothetical protein
MTSAKGFINRDPRLTRVAHTCDGHCVVVDAVHINVQEQDQKGDVTAEHDCAGIAWDHPALGTTQMGDEVEVTYDGAGHITDFRIVAHN